MTNQNNILETLKNRIATIFDLYQDIDKHAYLVPEILCQTIRDTHRYLHEGVSHFSNIQILEELQIPCSEEEIELLKQIESSLRKAKDYAELIENYDKNMLLNIVKKFSEKLNSLS
ncbi:MAG: hypothetical protein ACRCS8_06545 [Brevinema sp.]